MFIAPHPSYCFVFFPPQNGSYVLPMLWCGLPLKLSCPVQTSTPESALSVLCSSHGMAVQINREELDEQILGVVGILFLLA